MEVSYFFFLTAQLLLLEPDTLISEVFRQDRRITVDLLFINEISHQLLNVLGIRMDCPGQLLRAISFIEDIVRKRFKVPEVRAAEMVNQCSSNVDPVAYFKRALLSLLKSECFGLSTSATPQGYILARTGCPSISISSSEPMMANGKRAFKYVNKHMY
jgi:hypothetical protein